MTLSGNSFRQTVHTHCASVPRAAKLVAALLRVAGGNEFNTAGLAESNGSLPLGLWLISPAGWLPRTGISSGTLHTVIEYGLPLPFCYIIKAHIIVADVSNDEMSVTPIGWWESHDVVLTVLSMITGCLLSHMSPHLSTQGDTWCNFVPYLCQLIFADIF